MIDDSRVIHISHNRSGIVFTDFFSRPANIIRQLSVKNNRQVTSESRAESKQLFVSKLRIQHAIWRAWKGGVGMSNQLCNSSMRLFTLFMIDRAKTNDVKGGKKSR